MITLETNYSKKIGLPGYSSHQFSVSLKTELTDVSQVQQESTRLYGLLQQSVDTVSYTHLDVYKRQMRTSACKTKMSP